MIKAVRCLLTNGMGSCACAHDDELEPKRPKHNMAAELKARDDTFQVTEAEIRTIGHDFAENGSKRLIVFLQRDVNRNVSRELWRKLRPFFQYYGYRRFEVHEVLDSERVVTILNSRDIAAYSIIVNIGGDDYLIRNHFGKDTRDKFAHISLDYEHFGMQETERVGFNQRESLLRKMCVWAGKDCRGRESDKQTEWLPIALDVHRDINLQQNSQKRLLVFVDKTEEQNHPPRPDMSTGFEKTSSRFWRLIAFPALQKLGFASFEVKECLYRGHVHEIVEDCELERFDGIVVVSSDVIVSEVVTALYNLSDKNAYEKPVAVIPGTGQCLFFSILDGYPTPFLPTSNREILSSALHISKWRPSSASILECQCSSNSTNTYKLPIISTLLFGDPVAEIRMSGLERIRRQGPSCVLRAGIASSIVHQQFDISLSYLSSNCTTTTPTLKNWKASGEWITVSGKFSLLVVMPFYPRDTPEKALKTLFSDHFWILYSQNLTRQAHMEYQKGGLDFQRWDNPDECIDGVHLVEVKAAQIVVNDKRWGSFCRIDGQDLPQDVVIDDIKIVPKRKVMLL